MAEYIKVSDILTPGEIELIKCYANDAKLPSYLSFHNAEKAKNEAIHKLIKFMIEKHFI